VRETYGAPPNCWSTNMPPSAPNKIATWKWPAGSTQSEAMLQLTEVLNAYPQEGQDKIDGGGWSVVEKSDFSARVEFKSSGKGFMAKAFNGGQPYTDDFEFSVENDGVCVRSSARVGDGDFGVNAKRVNYFASALSKKGWDAKPVKAQ